MTIFYQRINLQVDYEDGSETHQLTAAEVRRIFSGDTINLNAALRIAKKRKFMTLIKGTIKE